MTNQMEMVNGVFHPMSDADQADYDAQQAAYIAAQPNIIIKQKIDALETELTLRRIREAINGSDNGWMENIDAQIATLRSQLK